MNEKKTQVNLTLDPDIVNTLKNKAKEKERSISNYLNRFLRKHFMPLINGRKSSDGPSRQAK